MSGECQKCYEHCLDCKCKEINPVIQTEKTIPCKNCGDIAIGDYCSFCEKLYFRNEIVRERETKRYSKIKEKREFEPRICKDCNVSFKPRGRIQNKCTKCNRKEKDRTPAEKWLAKKPYKNKLNSNQVAYGFFRKKYSAPNNVFRG